MPDDFNEAARIPRPKRRAFLRPRALRCSPPLPASAPARCSSRLASNYPSALAQNLSEQARKLAPPVGFADIVEKVKPAVISVRVKVDGGEPTSRQRRHDQLPPGLRWTFFRRFGMPDMHADARTSGRGGTSSWGRAPASSSRPTAMP